jgi:hypothetical protein
MTCYTRTEFFYLKYFEIATIQYGRVHYIFYASNEMAVHALRHGGPSRYNTYL